MGGGEGGERERDFLDFNVPSIAQAREERGNGRSSSVLLYVHTYRKDCLERGAQQGHLDFHTTPHL